MSVLGPHGIAIQKGKAIKRLLPLLLPAIVVLLAIPFFFHDLPVFAGLGILDLVFWAGVAKRAGFF